MLVGFARDGDGDNPEGQIKCSANDDYTEDLTEKYKKIAKNTIEAGDEGDNNWIELRP